MLYQSQNYTPSRCDKSTILRAALTILKCDTTCSRYHNRYFEAAAGIAAFLKKNREQYGIEAKLAVRPAR